MSCCGAKREQAKASHVQTGAPTRTTPINAFLRTVGGLRAAPAPRAKSVFQYTGKTAMAVIGPITGIRYSFAAPGTTVEVDSRDRRFLSAIPNLRQTA